MIKLWSSTLQRLGFKVGVRFGGGSGRSWDSGAGSYIILTKVLTKIEVQRCVCVLVLDTY